MDVTRWEANIVAFLLFCVSTQQSFLFVMARQKIKVLSNLGEYGCANTLKIVVENIRKLLKTTITPEKGKENKELVMIS